MPDLNKDLLIPKEFLMEFRAKVRIIDKRQWVGIKMIDAHVRHQIEEFLPVLKTSPALGQHFDLTLVYKGKELKFSNKYFAVPAQEAIIKKIPLIGIPVPWIRLKEVIEKAKINPLEWDLVYTPRG